jgi:hypothetical protein
LILYACIGAFIFESVEGSFEAEQNVWNFLQIFILFIPLNCFDINFWRP